MQITEIRSLCVINKKKANKIKKLIKTQVEIVNIKKITIKNRKLMF